MDNVIDKIREICEQKNISVSKMEKDLGFGNGYQNAVTDFFSSITASQQ